MLEGCPYTTSGGASYLIRSKSWHRPRISSAGKSKSQQHPTFTTPQIFACSTVYLPAYANTRYHVATMRLTTDLINNSLSFINCLQERELDLRGALKRTDTTLDLSQKAEKGMNFSMGSASYLYY